MEDIIIGDTTTSTPNENMLENVNFCFLLFRKISEHGNTIFETDGVSGKSLTFAELLDKARRLASGLVQLGVRAGEGVAICCENRLEYSSVMLACVFTGTVLCPINPAYSPDEICHVLNISKPVIIFCSALTYKNITTSMARLSGVRALVLCDQAVMAPSVSTLRLDQLLQNQPLDRPRPAADSDIAVVLTSSGTTGLPKGVMLNYTNLKYFCTTCLCSTFLNLQPQNIILGLLPLFHGYGYGMLLASILIGTKFILLPKFEEKLFLSTIEKYKISHVFLVPPLMVFLAKDPLVLQYKLNSVVEVVCGAAPLSADVLAEVHRRLPGVRLRQGYGMTEASIVVTVTPPHSNKPTSVGRLAPGIQAKIIDSETGNVMKRGKLGEILVRGRCVMAGYCGNPEATRQVVDSAGWLHTGDIGYVDNEGDFYVIDRVKELIKYKGYQVAPAELESILMGMKGIKDVAVIGLPDIVAGELPTAFVVLQPASGLTANNIITHVNSKLSSQKHLRGVRFVDSIPKNPSGKILRRILRDGLNSKL